MKSDLLQLRLKPAEKEAFQLAADLAGVALSAWVRERLRSAARRELVEAGKQVPFLQEKAI
jgi:predicted HicB family RNase H-like nuclease